MSTGFDWQTEDAEAPQSVAPRQQLRSPARRYLWLLPILGLALALLLLVWRQQQRVQAEESRLRQQILATFSLWEKAIAEDDLELFLQQLDPHDQPWRNTQRQLFLQDRLLDRDEFCMTLPSPQTAKVEQVSLAPDWETAELELLYHYCLGCQDNCRTEEAAKQTLFLRRQGPQWVITAPDESFWGEEQERTFAWGRLIFPQRDTQLVTLIGEEITRQLDLTCGAEGRDCPSLPPLTVRFDTDPSLLGAFTRARTPLFRQGELVLPAPTLLGLPADSANSPWLSGQYHIGTFDGAYADLIWTTLKQNLQQTAAFPEQKLQLLCFPETGRGLRLFTYDPAEAAWSSANTDQIYRFLMPVPGDQGVILQTRTRGAEAAHLRLYHWQAGTQTLLFDQPLRQQLTRPAGWAGTPEDPRLLLQSTDDDYEPVHHWLNLDDCDSSGCRMNTLSGFTTWSPDSRQTLIDRGSRLWLGDGNGQPLQEIGLGSSPFWIDDETYAYIHYLSAGATPNMAVQTMTTAGGSAQVAATARQLAGLLRADDPPLLFLTYATNHPSHPSRILVMGTTTDFPDGKYHLFQVDLVTGIQTHLLSLQQRPLGAPSLLTSAGYPPFQFSPDGRWLLVTTLQAPPPAVWQFLLLGPHNRLYEVSYPPYPALAPFYDWSADGRWLAIVDEGFVRLINPEHDTQYLVPYPYESCLFAAWTNN